MIGDSKPSSVRPLDRINLRLPAETFEAIDALAPRSSRQCLTEYVDNRGGRREARA